MLRQWIYVYDTWHCSACHNPVLDGGDLCQCCIEENVRAATFADEECETCGGSGDEHDPQCPRRGSAQ